MNDNKIIQLDSDISNKIAAGEVVERPLAVVKELVENAIDARASKITVEIKDAGKRFIRITDNGRGIDPNDMQLAFKRHSTSKIRTINDIYNISSLGFRGEALASIASVSNVEIISKHVDHEEGKRLVLSGGHVKDDLSVGAPQGTTIFVKELFFNTPARLKFLKSNHAEQTAINDIMNKLAMSHPEVKFKYIVNGQNVFITPGNGKLFDVIANIYQRSVSKNLIEVNFTEHGIGIEGYISNIETTRGNRQQQITFVNHRYVKSQSILDALNMAYKTLIPHNRYAICFINVRIDPSLVDINIHPSKTEIRFHQEGHVKDLVYKAIKEELNKYNLVPSQPFNAQQIPRDQNIEPLIRPEKESVKERQVTYDKVAVSDQQVVNRHKVSNHQDKRISDQERSLNREKASILTESYKGLKKESQPLVRENSFVEKIYEPPQEIFEKEETIYDNLRYIGQSFNSFLIYEKGQALYLIDQHAAHEKILYESYIESFEKENILSQMILEPILIEVNYMEKNQILHYGKWFSKLGFQMESFGDDTIIVREIPQIFTVETAKKLLQDLVEKMDFKLPESQFELDIENIIQQSCKRAIKANHSLNTIEVTSLIDQLKLLKDPYTCPHGRPIIISIGRKDIEKKFNRT